MLYINYLTDNRILRIFLVTLLILSMVFCSFFVQYSYADFVLLPSLAVIGTLLISAGLAFATDDDLTAAATALYRSLDAETLAEVSTIADSYVAGEKYVFKATSSLVNAVSSWLASQEWGAFEASGNSFLGGFTLGSLCDANFQGIDCSSLFHPNLFSSAINAKYKELQSWSATYATFFSPLSASCPFLNKVFFAYNNISGSGYRIITYNDGVYSYNHCDSLGNITVANVSTATDSSAYRYIGICLNNTSSSSKPSSDPRYTYLLYVMDQSLYLPLTYSGAEGSITTLPETNVQADTTYFPREVVDAGTTTTFPSTTASQPLTTDLPLTIPETGVNSGTTVGDVRTDAGTAEGEETGTVIGWLEKLWDGVISIPDAIASGVTTLTDGIATFFDPSGFSLDFSDFKLGLTEVFPFCIPFDFVKGIKTLASDSAGFSFDIQLETSYFQIDHKVDLAPYRVPILFFRFICDFWFCYILISRTRDWIKW